MIQISKRGASHPLFFLKKCMFHYVFRKIIGPRWAHDFKGLAVTNVFDPMKFIGWHHPDIAGTEVMSLLALAGGNPGLSLLDDHQLFGLMIMAGDLTPTGYLDLRHHHFSRGHDSDLNAFRIW